MSRAESSRLERKPVVFEGGSISGAWQVEEPRNFEEGLQEGDLTNEVSHLAKRKWDDDAQVSLFHPENNPKAAELAEVRFDREMKFEGPGGVREWLKNYNVWARQNGMPTYALANRSQLLAWRRATKGDATQEYNKYMVAGGSSTISGSACILFFSGSDDGLNLYLFRKDYDWTPHYSLLLVRTD